MLVASQQHRLSKDVERVFALNDFFSCLYEDAGDGVGLAIVRLDRVGWISKANKGVD